ncbi:sensor histidine kinase [Nocardia sp. IFM 10818]
MKGSRRGWAPDIAAALVVLLAGAVELLVSVHYDVFPNRGSVVPVVVATAVAVGCCRRWPAVAVAVIWLISGYQVVASVPVLLVQVALAAAVFAGARWGDRASGVLGALAIPVVAVPAALEWGRYGALLVLLLFGVCWWAGSALRRSADRADRALDSQRAAEADAARAHRESEQAREIAALREEQAQLARDVHDVVGHSLAVILAQAESARYIADTDTGALRQSMANIADLARSSLQDVRQVLTATASSDAGPGALRTLIDGVRASGHEVVLAELGTARTLAPELATVAYRVLQEMLTNAIRHGNRATPINVELCWADELRIETVNAVAPGEPADAGGSGLGGMRRRLESVGGRLDIRCADFAQVGGSAFTVTAWVPMRRLVP